MLEASQPVERRASNRRTGVEGGALETEEFVHGYSSGSSSSGQLMDVCAQPHHSTQSPRGLPLTSLRYMNAALSKSSSKQSKHSLGLCLRDVHVLYCADLLLDIVHHDTMSKGAKWLWTFKTMRDLLDVKDVEYSSSVINPVQCWIGDSWVNLAAVFDSLNPIMKGIFGRSLLFTFGWPGVKTMKCIQEERGRFLDSEETGEVLTPIRAELNMLIDVLYGYSSLPSRSTLASQVTPRIMGLLYGNATWVQMSSFLVLDCGLDFYIEERLRNRT
jgi:hypothetical protein